MEALQKELSSKHQEELKALKNDISIKYEEEMKALCDSLAVQQEGLLEKHSKELEEMKKFLGKSSKKVEVAHKNEIMKITEDLKNGYEKQVQLMQERLDKMKEELDNNNMASNDDMKVSKLAREMEELTRLSEESKAKHDFEIQEMQGNHGSTINAMNKRCPL